MRSTLFVALLATTLLLFGCDHQKQPTANPPAVRGDSELTGVAPEPFDSVVKRYPRATLVALPADVAKLPPPPGSAPVALASSANVAPSTAQVPLAVTPMAPPADTPPSISTVSSPAPAASTDSTMDESPGSSSSPSPSPSTDEAPLTESPGSAAPPPSAPPVAENEQVAVLQTSAGQIVIELDDYAAPKTCKNFRELIADGFYNNTVFHRVIPDFIIQGGDPNSKSPATNRDTYGLGSPGYTLPAEISLRHDRGAVAMARLPDSVNPQRESNGSQFYICLAACPTLDDQYTVFGHVIKGIEVADAIAHQPRDGRDNPLKRIEMTIDLKPKDEALATGLGASSQTPSP